MRLRLIYPAILIFLVAACVETEPVSPIPEITYQSIDLVYYYDSLLDQNLLAAELVFDFIDGDADLGIYPSSMDSATWNEENYNIFLIPYEKVEDSLFTPVETDTANPPPWYTIQHNTKMDRVGQNRIIKGNISLLILDLPKLDSMRYDFYIRDRAGNISNIESSDVFSTNVEIPGI
ncbi:MAG: hypothetical protein JW801_02975 [Bacteroidales bacterium]|nr:hypothetical protein [Bacteroidales bacterium]